MTDTQLLEKFQEADQAFNDFRDQHEGFELDQATESEYERLDIEAQNLFAELIQRGVEPYPAF